MLKTLPPEYVEKMNALLGPQAEAFFASYEQLRTQGLRLNPLKIREIDRADWLPEQLQPLTPVPWCRGGYYYEEQARPGKHPYHAAGVYYIQEPSAMSAAEALDPQPGDIVLDLAAAPGGKATQIAGRLQGRGLLVANEIHPARAKILAENIERMGIRNAVVTNESPDRLAERFAGFFDRIMVDAPCSGEGMFRKDPDAVGEWSPEQVAVCADRQRDILSHAVRMLKPGGTLAYSTCTFSPEENEDTVRWLIARCPEFRLLRSERIWPHLHRGEGHFVAVLRKREAAGAEDGEAATGAGGIEPDTAGMALRGSLAPAWGTAGAGDRAVGRREADAGADSLRAAPAPPPRGKGKPPAPAKPLAEALQRFREFAAAYLPGFALGPGEPVLFGEQLYWLPHAEGCPFDSGRLRGLKTVRPGLHLGSIRKNRLEPAHALALAAEAEQARSALRLRADDPAVLAYLRGEALPVDAQARGWMLVTVDGFPLGWGKASGGQLKNHYPKGLRWLG